MNVHVPWQNEVRGWLGSNCNWSAAAYSAVDYCRWRRIL